MLNRLLVFIVLLLFFSCSRSIFLANYPAEKYTICEAQRLLSQKLNDDIKFNFNGQIVFDNQTYQIKGSIINIGDSIVFMNLVSSSLGMEIVRIKVSTDSVFLVDKMNKKYMVTGFDSMNSVLKCNINFELFKSVIFGYVDFTKLNQNCSMNDTIKSMIINSDWEVAFNENAVSTIKFIDNNVKGMSLQASYNYSSNQVFAERRSFLFSLQGKEYKIMVNQFELSKQVNMSTRVTVPASYQMYKIQ